MPIYFEDQFGTANAGGATHTTFFRGGINTGAAIVGPRVSSILASSGNTAVTAVNSGGTYLFDTAAGITYTLPTPTPGMSYNFVVTTSVTSSNHKVITNTGTVLLQGTILGATTTATMFESLTGSSNISVTMNGSTTGGLVGTELTFRCLSATLWQVTGNNFGSGSPATPFANS